VLPRRILRAVPAQAEEISLAERLRQGPLTLAYALQCAADIAVALGQLHAQARTHGNVNAGTVYVRDSSAHLAPGTGQESELHDVKCFGIVLHQLLHGFGTTPGQAIKTTDRLVASATELARRCISAEGARAIRRVVVEVRVLAILARQRSAEPAPAHPLPAVVAPAATAEFDLRPSRSLQATAEACPKCGSHYVYASKPRTWTERLTMKLGVSLHRCHRCYHRYCTLIGLRLSKNAPIA